LGVDAFGEEAIGAVTAGHLIHAAGTIIVASVPAQLSHILVRTGKMRRKQVRGDIRFRR
jgi:hypothetical protein